VEKYVDIGIIDDMIEEKDETFSVHLRTCDKGELTHPKAAVVTILSDDGTKRYFRHMNRLLPKILDELTPGMVSWKNQLIEATSVNAGDLTGATLGDICMHVLSFPFKVLFACVPPPTYAGGWLTFVVALLLIGVLTAIVGESISPNYMRFIESNQ
jgi:hypothetical protein